MSVVLQSAVEHPQEEEPSLGGDNFQLNPVRLQLTPFQFPPLLGVPAVRVEEKKDSFSVAYKVIATISLVAQESKKCPVAILDLKVVRARIGDGAVIHGKVGDADAYDVAFINYYRLL